MTEPAYDPALFTADALRLHRSGQAVIASVYHGKKPIDRDWPNVRNDEDDIRRIFATPHNLSVLQGEPSGWRVTLDYDNATAALIAAALLPTTSCYGRRGSPNSHDVVISPGARSQSYKAPGVGNILDVLSTGRQAVRPPSIHPSGEIYEYANDAAPVTIEASELDHLAALVAVGVVLVQCWGPEGNRHDLALATSGVLLKAGVPLERARTLMTAIARAAGDTEIDDRLACLESSAARLASGQTVAGWNRLKDHLDAGTISALKRWLREPRREPLREPGTSGLPVINTKDRQLRDVTDEAAAALTAANEPPRDFRYGDLVVEVRYGADGRPRLRELNDRALRGRLTRAADFVRVLKDRTEAVFPPGDVVADLVGSQQLPYPQLRALVELPILRADGTIFATPGYDPATCRYYAPPRDAAAVPAVPESPSDEEVRCAVALLTDEALIDFPFIDPASRANGLGLLLTPIVALLIGEPALSPLQLLDAAQQGSGKTTLLHLAAIIASGRTAPMMALPDSDEELRKQITSALAEGAQLMAYDNVERRIDSEHLSRALTSPIWKDRLLSTNRTTEVPTGALWAVTGNNLALGGDLARRCVLIRLDPKTSRPWRDREFHHADLLGWAQAKRAQLVWSLLVLVRSWIAAGRPAGGVPRLSGFDGWARTVGGILHHVGVRGFLGNLETLYAQTDEEAAQWEALLLAWRQKLGEQFVTTAGLHQMIASSAEFVEALPEKLAVKYGGSLQSFNIALGAALARRVGRRYGSGQLYVERDFNGHTKIAVWRVRGS